MKTNSFIPTLVAFLGGAALLLTSPHADAQWVADGGSVTLANVTNFYDGTVIVGTNQPDTTLVCTNSVLLTNAADGVIGMNVGATGSRVDLEGPDTRWLMSISTSSSLLVSSNSSSCTLTIANGSTVQDYFGNIGYNATATGNSVNVTGANSLWNNDYLYVGYAGSTNRLLVSNGGKVNSSIISYIGSEAGADYNQVIISDPNSAWTNSGINVGSSGADNSLVISNGARVVNTTVYGSYIGFGTNADNNQATVSGANSLWTPGNGLTVGQSSSDNHLLVANGGQVVDAGDWWVGENGSASNNAAAITGAGSALSCKGLSVGFSGTHNSLLISEGARVEDNNIVYLGYDSAAGFNQVTVSGPNSIWTNSGDLYLNFYGFDSTLVITNGGQVVDSSALMSAEQFSHTAYVIVTGAGSLWTNSGELRVGMDGDENFLIITNGGQVFSASGMVSDGIGGEDIVTVTGAGSLWTNSGSLHLAETINGFGSELDITDGGGVATHNFEIGYAKGSGYSNLVTVAGSGSWLTSSELFVGDAGSDDSLTIADGGSVVSVSSVIGNQTGSGYNQVTVTGANSLWNAGNLTIGNYGGSDSLFVTSGGTVQAGGVQMGVNTGSDCKLKVADGTLNVTNAGGNASLTAIAGNITLNGGTINADQLNLEAPPGNIGTLTFNSGTLNLQSLVCSNLSVLYVGHGSNPATLNLLGQGALLDTGLTVRSNATLQASGPLSTPALIAQSGSTIAIGTSTSPGSLTNTGALTLNAGSVFRVKLNGTTPGSGYDQWVQSGSVNLGNATLDVVPGFALALGDSFTIIQKSGATPVSGTFNGLPEGATVYNSGPLLLTISYHGGDGNDVVLTAEEAPPYGLYFTNSLGGDYQTAGNWSLDFVPRPVDTANFTNDASYQVTWSGDAAAANANFDAGSGTVTEALGSHTWLLTNSYILGGSAGSGGNVTHASGTLLVTNAADTARLEVRRGTEQINDGVVEADRLLLTNTAGLLDFNGGTLITRGGTVDNAQPLSVGASGNTPAVLDVRSGTPLVINTNFNLGLNNSAAAGSRLFITNGGTLAVAGGSDVGATGPSDNNLAVVSGLNSVWTNGNYLFLGYGGSGNQLVVSNGAALYNNTHAYIGYAQGSAGNGAVVTGPNSVWASSQDLNVGWTGSGNHLFIRNGSVVECGSGFIGNSRTSQTNLAIVSDTNTLWESGNQIFIGDGGSYNQLVVSNAATVRDANGNIGWNPSGSNNTVVVTGAGTVWTNSQAIRLGNSGPHNTLRIEDSGEVDTPYLWVGLGAGSSQNLLNVGGGRLTVNYPLEVRRGTLQLDGGTVTAHSLVATNATLDGGGFITFNGGTLVTHGGTVDNGQTLIVGKSGSTPAVLDVRSGTPLTVGKGFYLGDGNTAATGSQLFITNGGSLTTTGGNIYFGYNASSHNCKAVISGPNSLLSSSDFGMYLNSAGDQLVISNGATVTAWYSQIGSGSLTSNNVVVVTGAGSLWTNYSGIYIVGSAGQVLVRDGARVDEDDSTTWFGYGSGAHGDFAEVTGTNSIWNTLTFYVSYQGSDNSLSIGGGGLVLDGEGDIGYGSGGTNNRVTVAGPGSLWTSTNVLHVGYGEAGSQLIIIHGGTVQAPQVYLGYTSLSVGNRIVITDGSLFATNNTDTGVFDIRRGTNVFNAGLIEADSLTMNTGTGFCEFNGGILRARSATVADGLPFTVGNGSSSATYQLLGNGLHTFADGLVIANNAQLIGNGTVAGPLTVQPGGTVAPGASLGTIVLSNSPALQGNVVMEISKNGSTLAHDQIQVAGPLTYDGTLTVSNVGPTALAAGDSFQLFTASSYSGTFTATNLPALGAGLKWSTSLTNGTLTVVATTPPTINGVTVSGSNLVFNVTGGSPNGAYDVLTSTNVALPLSSWTTNSTGTFDAFGNAAITNGINFAEPQRFFTISVP